jgi:hypothetical protein
MELWKESEFDGSRPDLTAQSIGVVPLLRSLLAKKYGHLSEFSAEGYVKVEAEGEDEELVTVTQKYFDLMVKKGGRLIHRTVADSGDSGIFLWDNGVAELDCSTNYVSVHAYSTDEKFIRDLKDHFDTQWTIPERTGHIYAIVKQGFGLGLSSIGNAGIALVDGNYTDKVLEDYKFAIHDLKTAAPSGRIVIMKGPPGTGKTHLIRAMLLEVPDAMFVLIAPDVVGNIAGPDLLPLLMSHRGGTTGPIVLILEDADKCLVSRNEESENMSLIQSLLNLGDGILGSLLDLRIVATTNADEFKMDPAILRPGRLSKMLDVSLLDFKTAKGIFTRLLPDAKQFPEKLQRDNSQHPLQITLAEVYSLARKAGWEPGLREVEDEESTEESEDFDI